MSGETGRVLLEDLAGMPDLGADWDYNDRSWDVYARPYSTPEPVDATATSGPVGEGDGTGGGDGAGSEAGMRLPVVYTNADDPTIMGDGRSPGAKARLTTTVLRVGENYFWSYSLENLAYTDGIGQFGVTVPNRAQITPGSIRSDLAGWVASSPSSPSAYVSWYIPFLTPVRPLQLGESATFSFTTPEVPIAANQYAYAVWPYYSPDYGSPSDICGPIAGQLPVAPGAGPAPKVVLTRADGTEAGGGLKVAKWQDAFEVAGGQVQVRGPAAGTNWDFIDRDPDRFNVWVHDPQTWAAKAADGSPANPRVEADIWTENVTGFTAYNDNRTKVDLVRFAAGALGKGEGWYYSNSQMLVSNEADDKYKVATQGERILKA